jgi:serralysin
VATVTDITTIPLTNLINIDALLDKGPNWNYLTGNPDNTIYYTFSTFDALNTDNEDVSGNIRAFTANQKHYTREALDYLTEVTGIEFAESFSPSTAQISFVNGSIVDPNLAAECRWESEYYYMPNDYSITSYRAKAIIYLDDVAGTPNTDLAPGGYGYETLLHEMGHMLGLKHPFSGDIVLPDAVDDTGNTLMSYTSDGYMHTEYSAYDLAALHYLYGVDGLRGEMGVNSAGGIWLEGDDGDNVLTGAARGDVLAGGLGDDVLTGLGGDDVLIASAGDDIVDGGAGIDTLVYGGDRSDYDIVRSGRSATISDKTDWDGVDRLIDVERVVFTDTVVALDIDGAAGSAYRLYQAAFDRTPDAGGLGYWIDVLDNGTSLRDVAAGFMHGAEFAALYGSSNPDNVSFVTRLYQNILHRAPEQGGFAYWTDALNKGADKAEVMAAFSESAENKALLVGVIGDGFEYTAYTA